MDKKFTAFVDYVLSFYGVGGVYDMGATRAQVVYAAQARIGRVTAAGGTFEGDSLDREHTSHLLAEFFGLQFPH